MTNKLGLPYSESYKNQLFEHWFKNGKPGYSRAFKIAFADEYGRIPSSGTIKLWLETEWEKRGEMLDQMVIDELNSKLVYEKVEMLRRHSETAKEMQEKAIEMLKILNPEDFTSSSLIRLWSEGVRIERESAGLPQALEKMTNMTDEQLVQQIEEVIKKSPGVIEQIDNADND